MTDGRTDGIAIATTALAMRAMRRAVINLLALCETSFIYSATPVNPFPTFSTLCLLTVYG